MGVDILYKIIDELDRQSLEHIINGNLDQITGEAKEQYDKLLSKATDIGWGHNEVMKAMSSRLD